MVESKASDMKLFDFDEAKAIANRFKFLKEFRQAFEYKSIDFQKLDSSYNYIFEVLREDIPA